MTTTHGARADQVGAPSTRLDRPVLVSNLVSGALWLLLPAFWGAWPLSLILVPYVVAGSVFLAAVYARETLTNKPELLAWAVPWLVAVALWTWLLAAVGGGGSVWDWLLMLFGSSVFAALSYLGWQIVALAVRQLMAWRSAPTSSHG